MILLVVGLVAVIVVILIAVFLSIRLGRGDEHDDEPDLRPSGRNRRAEEDRWRERDVRDTRRVPPAARAAGRGERHGGMDDRKRASEPAYAARGAGRDKDRDYGTGPRRPARGDPADYRGSPARRRSPVPVAAQGRSRRDSGPPRRVAADGLPLADHPSMDFPAADYPAREMPSVPAKTRPDGGRSDSRRKVAPAPASGKSRPKPHRGRRDDDDDWPSSEWDKLSDEQYWAELSADKPLATMARPASNGKATAAKAPADEPTAPDPRTARKAEKPARAGAAGGRSSGRAQAEREYGHEQRGRRERSPQREPVTERLPVRSRQQPAVPAARLAAEAPTDSRSVPAGPLPSPDAGRYTARDGSRHPSLDTGLPLPVAGGTGAHATRDTGPLPARDGSRHPSLDTGPLPPRGGSRHPSLDTGARPARDANLDMLSGLASTPRHPVPGALDDDPLTSPSFSLKEVPATDSRSYGHARKGAHAGPGSSPGNGSGSHTSNRATRDGARDTPKRGRGSHAAGPDPTTAPPQGDYASQGYPYPAEPAAAAQWYAAPPAQPAPAPAYGNPYSYPGPGTGSSAGYAGEADHGSYLADPLRVYSLPAYESPASAYPDPASASYEALPAPGMAAPSMEPPGHGRYPGAYPEHPYGPGQGQPEPAQYQDGYAGYQPGYENGYGGDPYAGGGFGSY